MTREDPPTTASTEASSFFLPLSATPDADAVSRACAANPALAAEIRVAMRTLGLATGDHAVAAARSFGRLRILGALGCGGMASVQRAHDPLLQRDVALKLLPAALTSTPGGLERFRREALALARIRHPHIVAIHDIGNTDGLPWFTMELVEGESLQQILARRAGCDPATLTVADLEATTAAAKPTAPRLHTAGSYVEAAVRMVVKLAAALEHAHLAGIVHRDVKPGNVMVDHTGEPRLVDFGLARGDDAATVTAAGIGPGTPAYMAPEQISGSRTHGPHIDVYGLGVTLYEVLTLRRPFGGQTTETVFRDVLMTDPVPPRRWNTQIPRDLETVCLCAIEKDPARRYGSAAAFAEDLVRLLNLQPIRARPTGPMARTWRWIQRHPARTAAALVIALAMTAAGVVAIMLAAETHAAVDADLAQARRDLMEGNSVAARHRIERAQQRDPTNEDAQHLLEEVGVVRRRAFDAAESALGLYRRSVEVLLESRARAADLQERVIHGIQPMPDAMAWPREEERARRLVVDADEHFLAAGVALAGIERHGPDVPWVLERRAEMYLARWRSLSADENGPLADAYRAKVEECDVAGRHRAVLDGKGTLVLAGSPAGADVYLYRYQLHSRLQPHGEPRLVPVPFHPARQQDGATTARPCDTPAPGDVAFAVHAVAAGSVAEALGLRRSDLITTIGGAGVRDVVFVLAVDPAGAAARAGVRRFDRLITIAGHEVREEYDAEATYARLPQGAEYETVFARGEDRLQVPGRRGTAFLAGLGLAIGNAAEALTTSGFESPATLQVTSGGASRLVAVPHCERFGVEGVLTAYPLVFSPSNKLGTLPVGDSSLPPGSYLLVATHPGYEDLRVPFVVPRAGTVKVSALLLREGSTPPGFVHVPPVACMLGGDPGAANGQPRRLTHLDGFFIARAEVTAAEYAEFLDDPVTLAMMEQARHRGEVIFVPRDHPNAQPRWTRASDGRFVPDTDPDCPVHDIACVDADAYVRWRNERARRTGEPWTYALPMDDEWEKAARGADLRWFPWGCDFDWSFCSGQATRSSVTSEPVLRFLADESPYGVRDLAGGVLEWQRLVGDVNNRRPWRGGAWQAGDAPAYRASSHHDGDATRVGRNDGFRLVAWLTRERLPGGKAPPNGR